MTTPARPRPAKPSQSRMRLPLLAALAALAVLLAVHPAPGVEAQTAELVTLTSNVQYDVKSVNDGVHVAWDATVTNNDPASTFHNGSGFYYFAYPLPVLAGASNILAHDTGGNSLDITLADSGSPIVQTATVNFARGIFYGETYGFTLTYDLVNTRSQSIIVSPFYAYVPVVSAGDPSVVTVNLPGGDPWSTSLNGNVCARAGSTFTCTGSQGPYITAVAEASQPGRVASTTFDVPLTNETLNVKLTYFQGEEATAQHQQALVTAALPVIEQTFGFNFGGPSALNVSQGGQQLVLGYEGLTGCDSDSCDVVVSPVASDDTVIHELSHLWTTIYSKRWLEEGFAQLSAETVAPQLPAGIVSGEAPRRTPSTIAFDLDAWGATSSLIGADPQQVALEDAGYDYSLRFLETLRDSFGVQALQAVNRNIATSGKPADSQRFMDLLEAATGENTDDLFLTWVFPDSYSQVLAGRREARDRIDDLRGRLTSEGLPTDLLTPIQANIDAWQFDQALSALDAADEGLGTYKELLPQLNALESAAEDAGLTVPDSINDALINFDFDSAQTGLASAQDAVSAYTEAGAKVHEPRSLWTKFGLLGSSPGGSLDDARESFANGDFETSQAQAQHAKALIEGASSVAFKRLMIVAGFMAVLALAVGIAIAVGRLRERGLAEP